MEFFFLCGLIVFFCISVSYLFYYYQSPKPNNRNMDLPPGKMGLPYVGESLEFLNTGRQGEPQKFIIERMARFSSQIFRTCILGEPTAVMCGVAGNKFLFSNENKLVTAWWPSSVDKIFPSQTQTSSSKQESKNLRKLLPNFLKPDALQRYIGIMDTIAQRHFEDNWEGKEKVIVFPLAKRFTFWLACRLFLSIGDPKQVDELAEPFNDLASGIISIPIDLPGTAFNKGIKASKVIRKELTRIIKQRKIDLLTATTDEKKGCDDSTDQDILTHMLMVTNEEGQHMTEWDIANKVLGLLIGGHDTASAAITFVIKYLAELPHIYHQVYQEQMEIAQSKKEGELLNWEDVKKMKYSWNVACEVMRLAPPLQGAFREAIHDFTFAGFSVPKGWKLYWSTHSTHRNPEYFAEPEKFDPTRFEGNGPAPYSYVPFGGGPRMCPGKEYARLEILVFMHHLVKRFKWDKLIPDENIVVDPMPIPANGLPIRLLPHHNYLM